MGANVRKNLVFHDSLGIFLVSYAAKSMFFMYICKRKKTGTRLWQEFTGRAFEPFLAFVS